MFPTRNQPAPNSAGSTRPPGEGSFGVDAADQPGSLWVKITGQATGTNRYSWEQIDEGDTDAFDTGLANDFAAQGGTEEDEAPAYEINGRTDVPVGTRVRIWPAGDLTYYAFALGSGAGSGSGGSGAACVEWYTIYLHQRAVAVAEGQTVAPQQLIGEIGPHSNGAHLHLALGDGIPLAAPSNGFPIAGQSIDIVDWLGLPVNGEHVGDPPMHPAHFTAAQIATIEAHFGFPVNPSLSWITGIGSTAHDGWDYYAADLVLLDEDGVPTDAGAIGQPIYAAFTGSDVRTTVAYCQNLGGDFQWVTILRHQVGDCAPCPPSKIVCEGGFLRRYTCTPSGEWVYDGDVGARCETKRPPGSGSGSGSGPGKGNPDLPPEVRFESVSRVCPRYATCATVTEDYTVTDSDLYLILVDASTAPVTVTLPSAVAGDVFCVVKIDESANEVLVVGSDEGVINGATEYTISERWQGAIFEGLCDGSGWAAITGAKGAAGPTGPAGPPGSQGSQGPQGDQGEQGEQGRQGDQGEPGPPGADGDDGATGPQGEQGEPGEPGADGTDGVDGADGADGAPGAVWRTGSGAPSSGLGVDGDYYLDTATGDVYAKAGGSYSVAVNIKGPTGATGSTGATGPTGATGSTGAAGSNGTNGANADMTRTSTSSVAVGTGSKTFAYSSSSNLGWVVGTRLRVANSSTNWVEGPITSVSSTSVTITADLTGGSGTLTSWALSVAGERGQTGATGSNGSNGADGAGYSAGFIAAFGGSTAPSGWLECDGSAVSRATYSALYTAIGSTWGGGNGSTTFNIPNFQRRALIGKGGTAVAGPSNAVGNTGGSETHSLGATEMPPHTHTIPIRTRIGSVTGNTGEAELGDPTQGTGTLSSGSAGGSGGVVQAHNNMPPSAVVMWCIKT